MLLNVIIKKDKKSLVEEQSANLMESTEVSSAGFGRRPDNRTIISKDHISKLFQSQQQKSP